MALPYTPHAARFDAQSTYNPNVATFSSLKVLPAWKVSLGGAGETSKEVLEDSAESAEEKQTTLAAENAVIPVVYGIDRRGAMIANVVPYFNRVLFQVVWSEGSIEGVGDIFVGDSKTPVPPIKVTTYLGTQDQVVDTRLQEAFSYQDITYNDTLPGIAYSVIDVDSMPSSLNIIAKVSGRKVYDPRSGLTVHSDNPALILADFITNNVYGAGRAVDWASVATLANLNDTLVGEEKSRRLNLTLADSQEVDSWIETLRLYAGCWVVPRNNVYHLVPDIPSSVVKSFRHDDGNIFSIGPLKRRSINDSPNVMIVKYTNITNEPWVDDHVVVEIPGVGFGANFRRESEIPMPGIQDAGQATREAIKRLNKLGLSDLSTTLEVFDDGVEVDVGDVVSVSHPVGLSDKQFRVVGVSNTGAGRYSLALAEYDPAAYSTTIVTTPTYPDTSLPDPAAPPPPTGVSLTEEVYQMQNGTFGSRIRVEWVAPQGFPFVGGYRVSVAYGPSIVFTGTASARALMWVSPAIQEGVNYQVDVHTVSLRGSESPAASSSIVAQGKYLVPGDVPWLSAFEVGGEVRLQWGPAVDIDIWRYEIRYAAVGGAWEDGTILDRVDALGTINKQVPAGDWDLMVKALDSVGHYSANEVRRTVQVTLDDNSFLAEFYQYDSPTLTNMVEYRLGRVDTSLKWVTSNNEAWNTTFSDPMSSYVNPVLSYQGGIGELLTETNDYGLALSGDWGSEASVQVLSGTYSDQMELSDDAVVWDVYPDMAAKRTARHSRLRISNNGTVVVTSPDLYTRINAIPRAESGMATSAGSGPKTITLVGDYTFAKTITITPTGTNSRIGVVDNVIMGDPSSFDVYIFDSSGNQVPNEFFWQFDGV